MKQWNSSQNWKGELLSTERICSAQCAMEKSIQIPSRVAQTQGAQLLMGRKVSFLPILLFLLCLINSVVLLSHLLSKPFLLIQKEPCTISLSLHPLSSTPSTELAGTWHEETGMLVKLILCIWPFLNSCFYRKVYTYFPSSAVVSSSDLRRMKKMNSIDSTMQISNPYSIGCNHGNAWINL